MDSTVFYITICVSLISSLIVVTRKNPIYSAVFMVVFFTMIALDFLILRAPFLAVIQVLVYAGAIMVLYLFVVMLLNLQPEELEEEVSMPRRVVAFCVSIGLFCLIAVAIRSSETVMRGSPNLVAPLPVDAPIEVVQAGEVGAIGMELFKEHGLVFELTSILILIAIIGAIYLTKQRESAPRPTGADDATATTSTASEPDGASKVADPSRSAPATQPMEKEAVPHGQS